MKQEDRGRLGLWEKTKEMLPGQGVLDLPRINMLGNRYLELENHRGIISYTLTQTVIALKSGAFVVEGRQLEISQIDREIVGLAGIFEHVYFRL